MTVYVMAYTNKQITVIAQTWCNMLKMQNKKIDEIYANKNPIQFFH